jgi:hypothetical protein
MEAEADDLTLPVSSCCLEDDEPVGGVGVACGVFCGGWEDDEDDVLSM